jgi:two-component sensor histidine kinase
VRSSYLGVDEGDANPVIVEQHTALGTVLVQLLVEQQEEEVSGGEPSIKQP